MKKKCRTLTLNHAMTRLQHRMLAAQCKHLLRQVSGFLHKELSHNKGSADAIYNIDCNIKRRNPTLT